MSDLTGLLLQLGEVIEAPPLPWPTAYPHLFVRRRAEQIDTAQATLVHLWPEAIQRSVPSRRYEYLLGRLAAAALLARLGVPTDHRWVGQEGRRPLWPQSVAGAISHTDELLVVTAGRRTAKIDAVGVDVERLSLDPEAAASLRMCFTANEMRRLNAIEHGPVTGFSAKEALFKCLSNEAGRYFDFLDAEIIGVDPVGRELQVQLLIDLSSSLPRGTILRAAYQRLDGHVWTGVAWQNPACAVPS